MGASFPQICFFISQIIFAPIFMITTKVVFIKDMKIGKGIKIFFLSPFMVYIMSAFFISVISVVAAMLNMPNVGKAVLYSGEFLASLISILMAYLYARNGEKELRKIMMFTHMCFFMTGMAFNLVYESAKYATVFSIIMPLIASVLLYRYITKPVEKMSKYPNLFQRSMLVLPIIAEILISFRSIINTFISVDINLKKYEHIFLTIGTLFGYIVVIFILIFVRMIANDILYLKENIEANREIVKSNEALTAINKRLHKFTIDTLNTLVGTIEAKDEYTNGHSIRVANYSKLLALKCGKTEEEAESIYMCALLHDIGKIAVPDAIINKPDRLTNEEFDIIKRHPQKGADILKGIDEIPDLFIGALYHHERLDGKGYPNGVKGDNIPFIAQIIAVADSYDAMTSKRSYRPPLEKEVVIKEIQKGLGTQFNPDIGRHMLDLVENDKLNIIS